MGVKMGFMGGSSNLGVETSCGKKEEGKMQQVNKLFVYKTHPAWDYCGGGAAVIANNEKAAQELLTEYIVVTAGCPYSQPLFSEEEFEERRKERIEGVDCWVLIEAFLLKEEQTPRVIMCSWNWA